MSLFAETIAIDAIDDIDNAILRVLKSDKEYFRIKVNEIEPIVFKLQGGRFDDEYIPIETLKIIRIYRTSFKRYFKLAAHKEPSDDMLYFNAKRGSFELDIQSIIDTFIEKAVGKMTTTELTITLLFLIGAWFANKSYEAYLESKKELARIDADKEKTALLQRVLEKLSAHTAYASHKNRPPKTAIEMLEENESLEYGTIENTTTYTHEDAERFRVSQEETTGYETITDDFYIKALKDAGEHIEATLKNDKLKTFNAISKLGDNMPLLKALDKKQTVKLKVTVGKDTQGDIVEADIYEVVEA